MSRPLMCGPSWVELWSPLEDSALKHDCLCGPACGFRSRPPELSALKIRGWKRQLRGAQKAPASSVFVEVIVFVVFLIVSLTECDRPDITCGL